MSKIIVAWCLVLGFIATVCPSLLMAAETVKAPMFSETRIALQSNDIGVVLKEYNLGGMELPAHEKRIWALKEHLMAHGYEHVAEVPSNLPRVVVQINPQRAFGKDALAVASLLSFYLTEKEAAKEGLAGDHPALDQPKDADLLPLVGPKDESEEDEKLGDLAVDEMTPLPDDIYCDMVLQQIKTFVTAYQLYIGLQK